MERRMLHFWTIALVISAGVLMMLSSIPDDGNGASTAVIDIEEQKIWIDVSPDGSGLGTIDVSIRSSAARNVIMEMHYDLDGPGSWTVDGPGQLFMDPLEKKVFQVDISVPLGESADSRGDLTINAVVEGETSLDAGSDSIEIGILAYRDLESIIPEDPILDLQEEGSIDLELMNTGNSRISFMLFQNEANTTLLDMHKRIELEPGEIGTFRYEYDLNGGLSQQHIHLSALLGDGTEMESLFDLEFIKDGDLFHLLFSPGPFLLIFPDMDPTGSGVNLFTLGGGLGNIGLEIVEGPDGAYIEPGDRPDLENLERRQIGYDAGGFTGIEALRIRAYGFDGDNRVYSNTITVSARGSERTQGPIISTGAAVAGGGAAAVVALTAGSAAYMYSASEVFRYKWLLLSLIPLYSMTKGEKVLDHFFRGRLFEFIKENPGVTFTALKEHFEVNNGTLTYHLHKLEREELITYRNLGKYKLFYADGMRIKGCEVVISQLDRDIIEIISLNPGSTARQVISQLKGTRSQRTLSRHIKQLERKGFLVVERTHGSRRFFVSDDLERVLMPHRGVVEVAEVISSEA